METTNTPLFLTEAEVEDLTGFKQKKKQAMHLMSMGIPFQVNRSGRPIVARSIYVGTVEAANAGKRKPAEWNSNLMK